MHNGGKYDFFLLLKYIVNIKDFNISLGNVLRDKNNGFISFTYKVKIKNGLMVLIPIISFI